MPAFAGMTNVTSHPEFCRRNLCSSPSHIIVVPLIVGVLLFAATRPDTFRVQRTACIKAPPEKIFPLINDLRRFNTWKRLGVEHPVQ
jgi:hypothetical protein